MTRAGLCLLLLLPVSAAALEDGGQAGAWTKLAVGARAAGLGRAVSALPDDPYAPQWNPALLATQNQARLGSQAGLLPDGTTLNYLGAVRPFARGSDWAWGLSYAQFGVQDVFERRTGNTAAPDSTFHEGASLTTAGLAAWVLDRRVSVGADLKLFSQALADTTAGGLSGDLGLYWRTWEWLDIGLALRDPASSINWASGTNESLPPQMRAGARLTPAGMDQRLSLSVEVDESTQQAARVHAGLELWPWAGHLALRGGLDDGQWAAGLTARTTVYGMLASLDYAFASDATASDQYQQRLSLGLGFDL